MVQFCLRTGNAASKSNTFQDAVAVWKHQLPEKSPTRLHSTIFPHNQVYNAILTKNVGTRLNWINPLIQYGNK